MSISRYYQYNMRTVVHCAPGAIIRIPALFEGMGAKRVVLISDKGLEAVGIVDQLVRVFNTNSGGLNPCLAGVYTDIAQDAACETVNAAVAYARSVAADAILAVGGGSVLDASKGIKYALQHNITDIRQALLTGVKMESWPQTQHSGIPHIGVATTAGTGAEVSAAAVFYNEELQLKINLVAPFLEPDMAVLDANLTLGLPRGLTASTGMDAMTHALEAVASPTANPMTDAHAFQAARMLKDNLPIVCSDGRNVQARSDMLQASTMAINAFVGALSAIPVHNCAHALGAMYHIPHGDANAVLLPTLLEVLPEFYAGKGERLARALDLPLQGRSDAELQGDVVKCLRELQATIGCETHFGKWNVKKADTENIVMAIATDPASMFFPIPMEKVVELVDKVSA